MSKTSRLRVNLYKKQADYIFNRDDLTRDEKQDKLLDLMYFLYEEKQEHFHLTEAIMHIDDLLEKVGDQ